MSTALQIAISQIGTCEDPKGSNWGPKVKEYLNSVKIHSPAPWCMAFVAWCFLSAGKDIPYTASCTFLLNWAREQGKVATDPRPGDICLLLRKGGNSSFHVGIVERVGPWSVQLIEGNTDTKSSPEGFEVARRTRWGRKGFCFVRL